MNSDDDYDNDDCDADDDEEMCVFRYGKNVLYNQCARAVRIKCYLLTTAEPDI